jgi:Domain of unknown function (DUF4349)
MRRAVAGSLLALVVGGMLAGCSANSGSVANSSAGGEAAVQAPQPRQASGDAGQGDSAALPVVAGRQVIRSASIALTVRRDVPGAAARAGNIATAAGGYTASENTQDSTATLTLQVPQARLDQVLHDLGGLGHVTSQGASAQDVTSQLVDVRSRISSQQASVDRVRALLAKAGSISDIVSIEGELTKREADLESLEQRNAELTSQTTMSAITVTLGLAPPPPATKPVQASGFVAGLSSGWHAFVAALGVALVVVGAVLPFVVILGLPSAVVWWWLRRRRVAADHNAG